MEFYASQKTLKDAVKLAGAAKDADENRHPHQRRIPEAVLCEASARLAKCDWKEESFDELHRRVKKSIGAIRGAGELMVYDTACRIGARLGIFPDKVYLHAGTRDGARAAGLNHRARFLELNKFPIEFQALTAGEIEDCLCIYKTEFELIRPSFASSTSE